MNYVQCITTFIRFKIKSGDDKKYAMIMLTPILVSILCNDFKKVDQQIITTWKKSKRYFLTTVYR